MSRPLVYVAGPYSAPTEAERLANVNRAIDVGRQVYDAGGADFVPHLSHYAHARSPRPYEGWLSVDFAIVDRCNMLVRIPGPSQGADAEVARAKSLGIPVYSPEGAADWIHTWLRWNGGPR